ncbi:MAG: hypothetical protein K2X27_16225 [Candidatus Obscuribacterales bacterium]|nr:hypothetical protein [Candidatus Obscuribacterales bacterium]
MNTREDRLKAYFAAFYVVLEKARLLLSLRKQACPELGAKLLFLEQTNKEYVRLTGTLRFRDEQVKWLISLPAGAEQRAALEEANKARKKEDEKVVSILLVQVQDLENRIAQLQLQFKAHEKLMASLARAGEDPGSAKTLVLDAKDVICECAQRSPRLLGAQFRLKELHARIRSEKVLLALHERLLESLKAEAAVAIPSPGAAQDHVALVEFEILKIRSRLVDHSSNLQRARRAMKVSLSGLKPFFDLMVDCRNLRRLAASIDNPAADYDFIPDPLPYTAS